MICVNKNCNAADEDRMVSCWLCLGSCHLKCSGLRARDADALGDKSKSLQWSCPSCRIVGVEFYNFFKSYREEFDGIKNSFLALQSKLEKYGELFSKFKNLENFTSSPKSKRKATAKLSSNSNSPGISNKHSKPKRIAIPSTSDSPITPTDFVQKPLSPDPAVITDVSSDLPINILNQPQQLQISAQTLNSVSNKSMNNNPPEIAVSTQYLPSNSQLIVNPSTSCNNTSQFKHDSTIPKPLRVIPLLKTIFASRFAVDTTVLDIECFIKNKISQNFHNGIKIFKINARNRASFKIIVPEAVFVHLVDPNFWPKNAIVREFIYKSDDKVTLPHLTESRPKN